MKNEHVINYLLVAVCFVLMAFVIIGSKMADYNLAMQTNIENTK